MAEKLTMPTLTILFQQRAQTTIARSQKGIAALLVLMFLFNLDDSRIKMINDDLKAGITAATSQNRL